MWLPHMLIKLTLLICLTDLIGGIALPFCVQAPEPDPLPDDIIFSANMHDFDENPRYPKYNILGKIDAVTLEATQFYTDESAFALKPLSWSPDGRLLAILRLTMPTVPISANDPPPIVDLCTLTISGELQTCFEDKPSSYIDFQQQYFVTWSTDNQQIYFVAEDEAGPWTARRLVEADVNTGETHRVLYQTERLPRYELPNISWTSDLEYAIVGVASQSLSATLVNLTTGEEFLLDTLDDRKVAYVCPDFSPLDTSLVAISRSQTREDNDNVVLDYLIVIEKTGEVVRIIDVSAYDAINVDCPVFESDESTFYIYIHSGSVNQRFILSYSFKQDNLTEYLSLSSYDLDRSLPDYVAPISPLELSFKDEYILFGSYLFAQNIRAVTVVDSNNRAMRHFREPFDQAQWPIWMPTDGSE